MLLPLNGLRREKHCDPVKRHMTTLAVPPLPAFKPARSTGPPFQQMLPF
jgi:hypothetical protein